MEHARPRRRRGDVLGEVARPQPDLHLRRARRRRPGAARADLARPGARARSRSAGRPARPPRTRSTSVIAPLPHYRGQPSALIASIVVAMARQLELPEAEIDRIRIAALLHDVGKVAVPEEILEKPSALTVGRVADRRPAPAHRPGDPRAGGGAQGRRADHPPPPRAVRGPRLPVRAARQRDPARAPGSSPSPTPTTR